MDKTTCVYYIDEMLHELNEDALKKIYSIVTKYWFKNTNEECVSHE